MSQPTVNAVDLVPLVQPPENAVVRRVSTMARGLVGSEILKIAADIRALVRGGREICNLTVGDFDPKQFPIPERLRTAIVAALERGETNYPPSDGVLELRQAVARFYERELGLRYPTESVLIAGGARPLLYGIYRTLLDPGDRVVYPTPSWNNNHYVHLSGAVGVPIACKREHAFLPTRDDLIAALPSARLVCLNSPLNPTGTAIEPDVLRAICAAILDENRGRERRGERPLYLLYDHVYWMLCFGDMRHVTPPELAPEMARYTLFVDGISKAFAATGVRVGWSVGPIDVIERMSAVLGHVGAWAPRAEQVATVALLDDVAGMRKYHATFRLHVETRLNKLHDGLMAMKRAGLPVDSLPPMGTIYLTARIHPVGRRTSDGKLLASSDDVRRHLLEAAGFAIVPFSAFGVERDEGWFRLSVGAVSEKQIDAALPRVHAALAALR
jgi:aspartate aminotransferase